MSLDRLVLRYGRGVLDPKRVVRAGFVQGADLNQVRLQGNSLDLRVKSVFKTQGELIISSDGQRQLPNYLPHPPDALGYWDLVPDEVYQVEFVESLDLPNYIMGLTIIRSTMAKSGCSGENGLFDCGYTGSTGMMVTVKNPTRIQESSAIAQIMFLASRSSHRYDGYYQSTNSPLSWNENYVG